MYATVLSSYDPAAEAAAKTAEKIARAKESLEQQAANKVKVAPAQKARSDNSARRRQRRDKIVKRLAAAYRAKSAANLRHSASVVAGNILRSVNAELPPDEQVLSSRPVEDIIRRLKL
jgi:hypothetical protein